MLDSVTRQGFAEQLGTIFKLHVSNSATLRLELFEVTELSDQALAPQMEQFSLLFRGPATPHFPQGIYTLEHENLGKAALFVVPVGPDSLGMRYQVIFNRMNNRSSSAT
jgi:hypothetical protein